MQHTLSRWPWVIGQGSMALGDWPRLWLGQSEPYKAFCLFKFTMGNQTGPLQKQFLSGMVRVFMTHQVEEAN